MANDENLPDPRPVTITPLMDVTFAALGWLNRTAQAVGSERFAEAMTRSRFYLDRARNIAATPAELAVITGLVASQQGLTEADAQARELLEQSLLDFDAAFEAGCLPAECDDDPQSDSPGNVERTDGVEPDGHGVPQDPAA